MYIGGARREKNLCRDVSSVTHTSAMGNSCQDRSTVNGGGLYADRECGDQGSMMMLHQEVELPGEERQENELL